MARPSRNTDKLLIQAARKLLPQTGCTGLNLRQVAETAGVNLGMFHYHFKTKEEFTRLVLEEIYSEFFKKFSLETTNESLPAQEQLRMALRNLAFFARENRALIVSLLRDVLNGDKEVIKFVKSNFGKHVGAIMRIVSQCQKEGNIADFPVPLILVQIMGSLATPSLIVELFAKTSTRKPMGILVPALKQILLSDKVIEQRIDMVLRSISVPPKAGVKS